MDWNVFFNVGASFSLLKTFLIAIAAYLFTLTLLRLSGRKTVSQMTFFVVMTILLDFLHIKSFKARKLLDSEPVVVIENGKIIEQNLTKIRLSMDKLNMQLRQKNIFNISNVEFAVMEIDGKLSVLPKSQKQPLTPSDLHLSTPYVGLTKDLIIDGEVMEENLQDAKLDIAWLGEKLREQGVNHFRQVFYAGLDTSGNVYVSKKRQKVEFEGKHGFVTLRSALHLKCHHKLFAKLPNQISSFSGTPPSPALTFPDHRISSSHP